MAGVNIRVVLFKSKTYADGSHPIMIWLSKGKERKLKSIGVSIKEKYWLKDGRVSNKHELAASINEEIDRFKSQYTSANKDLSLRRKNYSIETLIERVEKPVRATKMFGYVDELYSRLRASGKVKNAQAIKNAGKSFKNFRENKDLYFNELTLSMLHSYKEYLDGRGLKPATKHFYFRTLNTIYKKAIIDGLAEESERPFRDFNISKAFKPMPRRRSIPYESLKKVIEYDEPMTENQELAVDYFGFAFYARGMNFIDFAKLKWENVGETHVQYTRSKVGKTISFPIAPVLRYLKKYRKQDSKRSDYIFPILSEEHDSPISITNRIDKCRKAVNKSLKEVGEDVGIDGLTTYVARHSWATNTFKRSGSLQAVSQGLAHANLMQTDTYIGTLDTTELDKTLDVYE